jgi:hypothetical protein
VSVAVLSDPVSPFTGSPIFPVLAEIIGGLFSSASRLTSRPYGLPRNFDSRFRGQSGTIFIADGCRIFGSDFTNQLADEADLTQVVL